MDINVAVSVGILGTMQVNQFTMEWHSEISEHWVIGYFRIQAV